MTVSHTPLIRDNRNRMPVRGHLAAFLCLAALGAVGVGLCALLMPGTSAVAVTVSVTFYVAAAGLAGWYFKRDYPHQRLGLCNTVTLIRLMMVSALLAPVIAGSAPSWAFFAVATLALTLDGIDGWLARRQKLVSGFGARFDVEVDSILALVLAVNAAFNANVGVAIILLGLPRYAFALAALALPWLHGDLPERFSRKVVCVVQLATLITLQAPSFPGLATSLIVPVASIALLWSFSVDILNLWRSRS